jgi:predicted RNase H-like nuclease
MTLVAGVDACTGGWCIAVADMKSAMLQPIQVRGNFASIPFDLFESAAVDMPIGLHDEAGQRRACDEKAKKVLGKRACCVFYAPSRKIVEDIIAKKFSYGEAKKSMGVCVKSMTSQAFALCPKIWEADHYITPELQAKVFEIHPEICFFALNRARAVEDGKSTPEGMLARLRILKKHFTNIHEVCLDAFLTYKKQLVIDDILDAAVAALTAKMKLENKYAVIPDKPPKDSRGLRMEMIFPRLR